MVLSGYVKERMHVIEAASIQHALPSVGHEPCLLAPAGECLEPSLPTRVGNAPANARGEESGQVDRFLPRVSWSASFMRRAPPATLPASNLRSCAKLRRRASTN